MRQTVLKISALTFFLVLFLIPCTSVHAAAIKILLVPGHDNEVWGAQYGTIKEADMNLRLATELFDILKKDKRFEVHITRDSAGYTTEFANYFATHRQDILAFKDAGKAARQDNIVSGDFIEKEGVPHISVTEDMSVILYGINKWANENHMDAVLHIHFNDYPRENKWTQGVYKGFAVYIPDQQMANSKGSIALAKSVFTQLKKKYATSTYPKEAGGLVSDQSLIALGSNGTLWPTVRSVLVEYGYIYRFANSVMRHKAYTDMANLTATGLKNYFFPQ